MPSWRKPFLWIARKAEYSAILYWKTAWRSTSPRPIGNARYFQRFDNSELMYIAFSLIFNASFHTCPFTSLVGMGPAASLFLYIFCFLNAIAAVLSSLELRRRLFGTSQSYLNSFMRHGELFAFNMGWLNLFINTMVTVAVLSTFSIYLRYCSFNIFKKRIATTYPDGIWSGISQFNLVLLMVLCALKVLTVQFFLDMLQLLSLVNLYKVVETVILGLMHVSPITPLLTPFGPVNDISKFFPYGVPALFDNYEWAFFSFVGLKSMYYSVFDCASANTQLDKVFSYMLLWMAPVVLLRGLTVPFQFHYFDAPGHMPPIFPTHLSGSKYLERSDMLGITAGLLAGSVAFWYCTTRALYDLSFQGLFFSDLGESNFISHQPTDALFVSMLIIILTSIFVSPRNAVELAVIGSLIEQFITAVLVIIYRQKCIMPKCVEPRKPGSLLKIWDKIYAFYSSLCTNKYYVSFIIGAIVLLSYGSMWLLRVSKIQKNEITLIATWPLLTMLILLLFAFEIPRVDKCIVLKSVKMKSFVSTFCFVAPAIIFMSLKITAFVTLIVFFLIGNILFLIHTHYAYKFNCRDHIKGSQLTLDEDNATRKRVQFERAADRKSRNICSKKLKEIQLAMINQQIPCISRTWTSRQKNDNDDD